MSFSVVIPTYRRTETLFPVLDALAAQVGAPAFEVVVVDDGSGDETPARLAAFRPRTRSASSPRRTAGRRRRVTGASARRPETSCSSSATTRCRSRHCSPSMPAPTPKGARYPVAVLGYTTWPRELASVAVSPPHQRVRPAVRLRADSRSRAGSLQLLLHVQRLASSPFAAGRRALRHEASRTPRGRTSKSPTGSCSRACEWLYRPEAVARHHHDITFASFRRRQEKAGEAAAIFYASIPSSEIFWRYRRRCECRRRRRSRSVCFHTGRRSRSGGSCRRTPRGRSCAARRLPARFEARTRRRAFHHFPVTF